MHQRQLFKLLVLPSFGSSALAVFIAVVLLGYGAWSFINDNQLFYDLLFGPYGFKNVVWQHSMVQTSWQDVLFSSHIVYYIALGGVAVIVGLTVFTILQAVGVVVHGSSELLHDALDTRRRASRELFYRLGLRVIALVGWGVYAAMFFSSILPAVMSLNQSGILRFQAQDYAGALDCLGALALLLAALHMHVIFLRTVALRPRIFGGENDVVVAEAEMYQV
jgi:hypothetical protein